MTNAIHAMEERTLSPDDRTTKWPDSCQHYGYRMRHSLGKFTKIFDPFFTTKAHGMGTGLGLYNVRTILRKYHGDLTIESEVGKGTTFHLIFPSTPSIEPVPHVPNSLSSH